MRGFFSQFGEVTRLKLSRNKKTGASKHYAFVEFKFPAVAKIVAETMNNYLMFEKARLAPVSAVSSGWFPRWAASSRVTGTEHQRDSFKAVATSSAHRTRHDVISGEETHGAVTLTTKRNGEPVAKHTGAQGACDESVGGARGHLQGCRQAVQAGARSMLFPSASAQTRLLVRRHGLLVTTSLLTLQVNFKGIAKAQINKERTPEEYAKMANGIIRTERRRRAAPPSTGPRPAPLLISSLSRATAARLNVVALLCALTASRVCTSERRRRRKISEAGIEYEFPGFESSLPTRAKKMKFTE